MEGCVVGEVGLNVGLNVRNEGENDGMRVGPGVGSRYTLSSVGVDVGGSTTVGVFVPLNVGGEVSEYQDDGTPVGIRTGNIVALALRNDPLPPPLDEEEGLTTISRIHVMSATITSTQMRTASLDFDPRYIVSGDFG